MFAEEASLKLVTANAEDVLSFVQAVILVTLWHVPLAQWVFSLSTLNVCHALRNVKSAMETAANNVPLDSIPILLENVFSIALCLVLLVLITSHRSVPLALELRFCLEEDAILTKSVIKQVLAKIVELDSISFCSKVNVTHAHLFQILTVAFNAAKQINNFAASVKEDITSKVKEAVLNVLIAA